MSASGSMEGTRFWVQLSQLMQSAFNFQELRELSFNLGLSYETLGENLGLPDRVQALIQYMVRRGRSPELLEELQRSRPGLDWPPLPEDLDSEDGLTAPDHAGLRSFGKSETTFNISGEIRSGQVNIGGEQTFKGPFHVDMRETNIDQPQGDVVAGDKLDVSGDFRGANVNINSHLDTAVQTIETMPHGDDTQRQDLVKLIEELKGQLAQISKDRVEDAEKLSRRLESLAREANEDEPDREMLEIIGDGLKQVARYLEDILPAVVTITAQIVKRIVVLAM